MYHLLFAVVGVFMAMPSGETVDVGVQVGSVTECAKVINENLEPKVRGDRTYYFVEAHCIAVKQLADGTIVYGAD